jgi:hypothetical protein
MDFTLIRDCCPAKQFVIAIKECDLGSPLRESECAAAALHAAAQDPNTHIKST